MYSDFRIYSEHIGKVYVMYCTFLMQHTVEMIGDQALKQLASDSIIQILRKGYYRCDSNGALCTLIFIPDGTLSTSAAPRV